MWNGAESFKEIECKHCPSTKNNDHLYLPYDWFLFSFKERYSTRIHLFKLITFKIEREILKFTAKLLGAVFQAIFVEKTFL